MLRPKQAMLKLPNLKVFIRHLRRVRNLAVLCPGCERQIPISRADLFTEDSISPNGIKYQESVEEEIKEMKAELEQLKSFKSKHLGVTTKSVNIGNIVEVFAPILRGFNYNPLDCRTLLKPVDYIVFRGLSTEKITSIDFVEIKSGKARLGDVEKRIRKTVESGKVSLELFGTKRE